jgi:hypothetical protein
LKSGWGNHGLFGCHKVAPPFSIGRSAHAVKEV